MLLIMPVFSSTAVFQSYIIMVANIYCTCTYCDNGIFFYMFIEADMEALPTYDCRSKSLLFVYNYT